MERLEVLQQKLEHWCAASVRALSNNGSVQYRGHRLFVDEVPFLVQAPHLHLDFATHNNAKLRGVADGIALRLSYSDDALHQSLCPEETVERIVFELLEQLRCESLAPSQLPGIRTNINKRFLFWANNAASSKLVENDVGILLFSLSVVVWSRLLVMPIPEQIEDVIEHTRWGFADSIGVHLRKLKLCIEDQQAFSEPAKAIAKIISIMINEGRIENDDEALGATLQTFSSSKLVGDQWLGLDKQALHGNHMISSALAPDKEQTFAEYTIFSTAYDEVCLANKVIRPAQLVKLRQQLDKRIRAQTVNTHRVARLLQQLVSSPALSAWNFGQEQGYLDSARLSRLLTSPQEHRLFKQEQERPKSDTVISIVIDNSGSMTHHNLEAAALVDTLAKAFELADIRSEILGFTTGYWNGGRVAKDWTSAGKPNNPGRLNSTRHTVYKAAETPWRRSRSAIAGLLRNDLFREGIDGEALLWAAQRLEKRTEKNKIIMMISDGSPMDTVTVANNGERYLDQHLAQVAQSIEQRSEIKLCALGVGLDLSAYYQHNLPIDLQQELSTRDYFGIVELLHRAQ